MMTLRKLFYLSVLAWFVAGCEKEEFSGAASALVAPAENLSIDGQTVRLASDALEVTLSADIGGRISSLKYLGKERLQPQRDGEGLIHTWGNVLWTSPQSDWGWPPPEALDSGAYRVELVDNGVRLRSDADSRTGVSITKQYSLLSGVDTLRIDYSIANNGEKELTLAPWEVTRLPAAGKVFFPMGQAPVISGNFAPVPLEIYNGIAWFDYQNASLSDQRNKSMTDGEEGWLAYQAEDFLFVKAFDNVPAELMAPGEGEIELYVTEDHGSYLELEQQGYLTTLLPGESLHWQVLWTIAAVSPEAEAADRDLLVERARRLAGLALSEVE